MKGLLSLLFCFLPILGASAQDTALLQHLTQANSSTTGLQASFTETKTSAAKKAPKVSNGTLYILDADKIAMHYDAPAGDLFIINGSDFYMRRGKQEKRFDTTKNKRMNELSNTLFACLLGKPAPLAEGAHFTYENKGDELVLTFTAKKKQPRGYERIILIYDAKSDIPLIKQMQMDEFGGTSTLYVLSNIQTSPSIKPEVFKIP